MQMLGEWAHLDVIAAVAALQPIQVAAALTHLERAGMICDAAPARLTELGILRSPLTALSHAAREAMHARAAAELARRGATKPEICRHLLRAPGQGRAANVAILRASAGEETIAGQSATASELLQRALREPPPAQERPGVLLELAASLIAEGRHEQALRAAAQAREDADRLALEAEGGSGPGAGGAQAADAQAADAQAGGAQAADAQAERADGAYELQAAAEIAAFRARIGLGEIEPPLTRLLAEIGRFEPRHPDLALRMECALLSVAAIDARILHAGLRRYRERAVDESLPTAATYLLAAGQVLAMGGGTSAAEAVQLVRRGLRLHPEEMDEQDVVIRTVWLLFRADARDEAARVIARARERRPGGVSAPALDALEGLIRTRFGPVRGAVEPLADAFALARARRSTLASSAALAFLAIALLEADQAGALERLLAENDPGTRPGNAFAAVLQVVRGRLRLQAGQPGEALEDLLSVEERKQELGLVNPAGFHHIEPAVEALITLGEQTRASRLAQVNLQRAESWGAPITVALARGALARCMPPERGAEQMASALRTLDGVPASVAKAQLMLDCGRILIAAGRDMEARERLHEALDGAARLSAERLRRESHQALRSLGARPRRAHSHGVQSLTGAGRQVADLAAAGLANREIAERLHLSVRTVENHLRHVYGKLQSDRSGLARSLGREPG